MDTICLKISKNSYSEFGFHYNWLDHFNIELFIEDDTVIIRANKEGLESLAKLRPSGLCISYDFLSFI